MALVIAKSDCEETSKSAGDHLEMLTSCVFGAREEGIGALHQLDKVLPLETGEQRLLSILEILEVVVLALVDFD